VFLTQKNYSKKKRASVPEKWLEIFPYGLVRGLSEVKPILLFSDADEKQVFPMWVDHIDLDALYEFFQEDKNAPHPQQTQIQIIEELGWKIKSICFHRLDGYRLFATLIFCQDKKEKRIVKRAEDLILLALASGCKIYVSKEVIHKSRDIKDVSQLKALDITLGDYKDSQKYLM
tara:strand:+ start:3473 stop:3994 length:522 start_codon:yes stop_codon:yes gene_type:complete